MKLNLQFEEICYCAETHKIINYPEKEHQEFILFDDNKGGYVHGISLMSLEDTPSGSELMLVCVDYNTSEGLDFDGFSHVAYIEKRDE